MKNSLDKQQDIYAENGIEDGTDIIVKTLFAQEQKSRLPFERRRVGIHEDGRVKAQITCENVFLEEKVSVVLNDNNIGLIPFENGNLARVEAKNQAGESITLFGFFSETDDDNCALRTADECCYADSICKTLTIGGTEEVFGSYN